MSAHLPGIQDVSRYGMPSDANSLKRRRMYWLALVAGLGVAVAAVAPPFDEVSDRLLWAHMLQHMVLIYLAAPLLAIAALLIPGSRLARSRFGRAAGPVLTVLTKPIVAFGLSTAVLWLWHLPAAYDYALDHEMVHALEHLSFLAAFTLYWWVLVGGSLSSARSDSNEGRAFYLLAGAMQAGLLGGVLVLSDRVIYAHYLTAENTNGLSPLADQRLGGAVMWFPGPFIYGLAAVLTMRGHDA